MTKSIARDKLFDALRDSMREFARGRQLGDFGQVASDMEKWGDDSWDPIYKHEFDEIFVSDRDDVDDAMRLAAQFLPERHLVSVSTGRTSLPMHLSARLVTRPSGLTS